MQGGGADNNSARAGDGGEAGECGPRRKALRRGAYRGEGALPPLRVPVGAPQRKPLLVYTDAQYNHTKGRAGLGVVVVNTENSPNFISIERVSDQVEG